MCCLKRRPHGWRFCFSTCGLLFVIFVCGTWCVEHARVAPSRMTARRRRTRSCGSRHMDELPVVFDVTPDFHVTGDRHHGMSTAPREHNHTLIRVRMNCLDPFSTSRQVRCTAEYNRTVKCTAPIAQNCAILSCDITPRKRPSKVAFTAADGAVIVNSPILDKTLTKLSGSW